MFDFSSGTKRKRVEFRIRTKIGEALYTSSCSFVSLTAPGSPCLQQHVGDSSPVDIEHYMRRPDTLSDLPLLAFTRLYTLRCTDGPVAVHASRWRSPVVLHVVPFLLSMRVAFRGILLSMSGPSKNLFAPGLDIPEVYPFVIQADSAFLVIRTSGRS